MLKPSAIESLKGLGIDYDKLSQAIKAPGEVDVELPKGQFFTDEKLAERDNNMKLEGAKEKGDEMKTAGMEIASKTIAKAFNLDATLVDFKKPEKVAEAMSKQIAKGDDGLKEQIGLLQKDVDRLTGEKNDLVAKHQQAQFDAELLGYLPTERSNMLNDSEYLTVIKSNMQFEDHEGKRVVKRNGEIVRDSQTKNPLPIKDAVNNFFKERTGWLGKGGGGGRGGNDNNPPAGGVRTMSQLQEQYKKETGKDNLMSPDFHAYVEKMTKDVTDFNWSA